jgi:hypothetical protein
MVRRLQHVSTFTFRRPITKSLAMWTHCDLAEKCNSGYRKPSLIRNSLGECSSGP